MGSTNASYVGEIDALRCFAMSAVILLHTGLLPFGWTGVWLFFVISGFAISRSLLVDVGGGARTHEVIKNFYVKRALRILPLYLFYLLVVSVYAEWLGLTQFWLALPYLLSFTYNIAIALGSAVIYSPGVVQLWSISGEEQFYLAFPFIFVFLSPRARIAVLAAMLLACPPARALMGSFTAGPSHDLASAARAVIFFTPLHFDAFAAGSLIAILTHGRRVTPRAGRAGLAVGLGALAFYVVGYAALQTRLSGHFGPDAFHDIVSGRVAGQFREVFGFTAIWMSSAGVIIAVLARLPFVLVICRPQLFRSIGRVSYGGYVWHGFVTEVLTRLAPGINVGTVAHKLVYFVILYSISIAVAFASYYGLERPFLRLKPARPSRAPASVSFEVQAS